MKTMLSLVLTIIALNAQLQAEVDTGRPAGGTPYDRYLGPVRQTFSRFGGGNPTMDEVRARLRTARRFRYYFNPAEPYVPQPPEVTEARREGDCKAKSLWLADKMRASGLRYVIGKAKPGDRMSHAWLLWSNAGTWLFLDPTMETDVLYADRVAGRKLIAQYSYNAGSTYAHPTYSTYIK